MNTNQSRHSPIGQIDLRKILSRLCGDRDLLVELVEIYSEDYPILLRNIEQAAKERNGKKLYSSGHALKGLVSNFMHDQTTGLALKLERMGAKDEWNEIDVVVNQMRDAADHLLEWVTAAIENQ